MQGKDDDAKMSYLRAFALEPFSSFAQQELGGQGWSETVFADLRRVTCPTILDLRQWQTRVELASPFAVSVDRPLGIFVHIFYDELTAEIASYIAQIDLPKQIYITTKPKKKQKRILSVFDRYGLGRVTDVSVVPDYGTDIAPFLITFSAKFKLHDVA
jgi:lipopolysaccharide biosynthesis protein